MFYNWLFLIVILLIIESLTVNLITIWFAIGSVLAMFSTFFTNNINIQIAIFLIASFASLFTMRPIANKYLKPKVIKTNLDSVVGKIGIVTKNLADMEYGEVKVQGKHWTAKSHEEINEGSKVEILAIEGVKLIVKKIKEEK